VSFTTTIEKAREGCFIDADGCWHWRGRYTGISPNYRQVRHMRRKLLELSRDKPLGRLWVTCTCGSDDSCVNPAHASPAKPAVVIRKSRPSLRADHRLRITMAKRAQGKLDIDKARVIRAKRADGVRQKDVADEFGVSIKTVQRIEQHKMWAEISPFGLAHGR
jgi:DNA-binding XRE family transcriptional regulator